MGVGPSKTTLPKRDTFLNKTVNTQAIVNKIFIWMMNEVDIQDLLKLANPASCKEYVFVTKRALDSFFDTIQIEPTKGDTKDTLYFKPIKNATFSDDTALKRNPQLQLAKEERDFHCTRLAFFIVRIFQVFGALALSVIDALPDTQMTSKDLALASGQIPARFPLFAKTGQRGGAAVGEDDKDNLGYFYDDFKEYFKKPRVTGDNPVDFYIITRGFSGNPVQGKDKTIYFYPTDEMTQPNIEYVISQKTSVYGLIGIKRNTDRSYTLSFSNLRYGTTDVAGGQTFELNLPFSTLGYKFNNMVLPDIISTFFESLKYTENWNRSIAEILMEKQSTVKPSVIGPAYQQSYGQPTYGQPTYGSTTYGQPIRGEPREESGTPTGLAWASIRDAIRQRPKAYCVARALQLLNPALIDSVRKDTLVISDVCLQDSPFVKDRSVPEVNRQITSVVGISALNNLFYDTLDKNVPIIGPSTRVKYSDFLRTMDLLFNPSPSPTPNLTSLTQVVNKAVQECETLDRSRSKSIAIQYPKSKQAILPKVAMLLNRQLEHTSNVMKLLQQIFIIEKSGEIRGLQKSIQRGGLQSINTIAQNARNLLISYYQDCESMYRLGTLELFKTDEFKAQQQMQQQMQQQPIRR